MLRFSIIALLLASVYVALTANLQPVNLAVAGLIGLGATALVRPAPEAVEARRLPGALWTLARYLLILAVDIVKCGVEVARIVLDPRLPIRPGIVAIPSQMHSELGTALSAHAITITPGEMVIEIGPDGVMYTHCLDAAKSAAKAEAGQARRKALLERIFD